MVVSILPWQWRSVVCKLSNTYLMVNSMPGVENRDNSWIDINILEWLSGALSAHITQGEK